MKKILLFLGLVSVLTFFSPTKALAIDPCCKYTIRYVLGTCYAATLNNGSITDGAEHIYNDGDWAEFAILHCDANCQGTVVAYITGYHWNQPSLSWAVARGPYPIRVEHTQFDVKFHLHGFCYNPGCAPVVWAFDFGPLPCYKDDCGN